MLCPPSIAKTLNQKNRYNMPSKNNFLNIKTFRKKICAEK